MLHTQTKKTQAGCCSPTLAAAVQARQASLVRAERLEANKRLDCAKTDATVQLDGAARTQFLEGLYWATYLSILASYAQMFKCLGELDKVLRRCSSAWGSWTRYADSL